MVSILFRSVRHLSFASVAAVFVSIFTFFNLYVVHDYYLVAISLPAAILIGCFLKESLVT